MTTCLLIIRFTNDVFQPGWPRKNCHNTRSTRILLKTRVYYSLFLLVPAAQDPHIPPQKHNLAWRLKRSRSCACLRELRRD
ncbi:hypothetical protein NEOLEDRAFT_1140492 [Neolentinus lepideus HHB14362 ss-1]|uniref:Uncharacterized protein n=1 Tax=Neolentinus lepideus HHB14362 ss-1 TaxID=1314782 RepID=A0A165P847_9AGAM|nr:hypothetical protein NEOLEDRAFT_1140492 [Neolentinus lepideus HHB14362 ss-1]